MTEYIRRFSTRQRVEHFSVMVLFITLSLTGFPQKYASSDWAQSMIYWMGGISFVRGVHRLAGILFAVLTAFHLTLAIGLVLTGRSQPTIVPNRKDFDDAIQMLKYYLGASDQPARFGRFDYRQKFEYWGVVMGGIIMVTTGFLLYFPIAATTVLPGEFIPAAKVAHGNEGLMAFLVVILWHTYNAHFNPDVFPFDTGIFTGKISRERMLHEHPLELEEIERGTE
ncbi:MAG: formate dehydrogenase subunit gamma [Vicinamibacterales bacterium]